MEFHHNPEASGSRHRSYAQSSTAPPHRVPSPSLRREVNRSVPPEPPTAENLHHTGRQTFNIDPDVPYIEANAGEIEIAQGQSRQNDTDANSRGPREMVGGILGGVKTAMASTRERARTSSRPTNPTTRPKSPPTHRNRPPEADVQPTREPTALAIPESIYHPSGYDISAFQRLGPATVQFVTSTGVPLGPPQPVPSRQYYFGPRPDDLQRSASADASDGRVADAHGDEDSTVVSLDENHTHTTQDQYFVPPTIGSPILAQPRPASDYAKMTSPAPAPSFMSFHAHMQRIGNFFKAVNSLPWVSEERVTLDYIPKGARKKIFGYTRRDTYGPGSSEGSSRASSDFSNVFKRRKTLSAPRPLLSWYGGTGRTSERQTVDLLSGSSSSQSPEIEPFPYSAQATSAADQQGIPYSNTATPLPGAPPFPPETPQQPQPDLARSVGSPEPPITAYNINNQPSMDDHDAYVDMVDSEARLASNTQEGSAWPPAYPHGYVSYQPPMEGGMQNEAIHYIPMMQTQNVPVSYMVSTQSNGR
ncbi:hypothetical protein BDN71DRAFT_1512967 [Pleurotus eryngii]|uniref:Uncharacterized protein n=1 Tax=Pleurotus eryngii TaxID=5323 RepID=A0A9P5ZJS8_PLEER|nr:hypothetical protein BDN71DRAFT_1512967 [Pleurotus eryngii]